MYNGKDKTSNNTKMESSLEIMGNRTFNLDTCENEIIRKFITIRYNGIGSDSARAAFRGRISHRN